MLSQYLPKLWKILQMVFGKRKLTKTWSNDQALAGQHRPFGGPLVGPKMQGDGLQRLV